MSVRRFLASLALLILMLVFTFLMGFLIGMKYQSEVQLHKIQAKYTQLYGK